MAETSKAEVNARIVYWGAASAGKTSNLEVIHRKLRPDHRGDLRRIPTRVDPTVHYEMLPIELGEVGGVRTRLQVVTAPSGPEQRATRKQLLDQVDGVVFVIDSQRDRIEANLEAFDELRQLLLAYGRSLAEVPMVIQYNKRDRSDPYALEELHRKLDAVGAAAFESTAHEGHGVLSALTTISKRVVRALREQAVAAQGLGLGRGGAVPPPGVSQVIDRAAEAGSLAVTPTPGETTLPDDFDDDDFEDEGSFEDSLLAEPPQPEPEDQVVETATETRRLLDDAFENERLRIAPEEEPEALRIERVGQARAAGPRSVCVPLVLRDAGGRRLAVDLTVQIDPRISESGD